MQIFIDADGIIQAIHDDWQEIAADAYPELTRRDYKLPAAQSVKTDKEGNEVATKPRSPIAVGFPAPK